LRSSRDGSSDKEGKAMNVLIRGLLGLAILGTAVVCKTAAVISAPDADSTPTPYKCYQISDTHNPNVRVDLESRFGVEEDVLVGPAQYLCEPLRIAVGGVAELPAVAEGGGWPVANYMALAGGLAAAVVALTAGAWYARRRFSRG
jgi:hypothetical protein